MDEGRAGRSGATVFDSLALYFFSPFCPLLHFPIHPPLLPSLKNPYPRPHPVAGGAVCPGPSSMLFSIDPGGIAENNPAIYRGEATRP